MVSQQVQPDTARLRLQVARIGANFSTNSLTRNLALLERVLPLARRYPTSVHTGTLYFYLGRVLRDLGRPAESLDYFQKAEIILARSEKAGTGYGWLLYEKCLTLSALKREGEATRDALRCLDWAQEKKQPQLQASACAMLSFIFEQQGQTERSRYYNTLLEKLKKVQPPSERDRYRQSEAHCTADGDFVTALFFSKKTLGLLKAEKDKEAILNHLHQSTIALLFRLHRFEEARAYIGEALALNETYQKLSLFSNLWSDLAWYQAATGHPAEARRAAQTMLYYARLTEDPALVREAWLRQSQVYERIRDFAGALEALKKFHSLNDSLQNTKRTIEVAQAESRYRLDQKEAQIHRLIRFARLSHLRAENQAQQYAYLNRQCWLLAVIGMLAAVASMLVTYYLLRSIKLRRALKAQNAEIDKQAKALAEANQLKDRLFSILSHDLRGPVASIKAALVLQQDKVCGDAGLSGIDQQVNRLQELIDNLLYWSMNQRNGLRVYARPVSLHDLLNEVVETYKGLIARKQMEVVWEGPDICLQTDETLAVLVIRNIFHNALKFTPPNGRVRLVTEQTANKAKLHIVDTGIGMNASLLPGLSQRGTGLGLPLSADLMKLCGGSLRINSTLGAGTTVTLTWLI